MDGTPKGAFGCLKKHTTNEKKALGLGPQKAKFNFIFVEPSSRCEECEVNTLNSTLCDTLNTLNSTLCDIDSTMGFNLVNSDEEKNAQVEVVKELEYARYNLYVE